MLTVRQSVAVKLQKGNDDAARYWFVALNQNHTSPRTFTTQRRRERLFRPILPRDFRVAGHVKFVGRRAGLVAIGVLPYLALTPKEKQIEIIIE